MDLSQWHIERVRLDSFNGWPVTSISPELLSSVGFYYLHESDSVRCAFCGIEISDWGNRDIPREEHIRHAPLCRFINNRECGNVPIPVHSEFGIQYLDGSVHSRAEHFDICRREIPLFAPQYADETKRFLSFESWPIGLKTTPHMLYNAGFYYTGTGDRTFCFDCGVGIIHWLPNDNPWVDHAKYSPNCNYLLTVKGASFVKSVQENLSSSSGNTQEIFTDENNELNIDETTLSEKTVCKVCYKEDVSIVLLPCNHLAVGILCAVKLTKCPVCRQHIQATLHVYLC